MANNSIQDILGWVALTDAVNAVKDGVPNPFPKWLFTVKSEDKIIGNSVKFNRYYGTKKTARVVEYGAPAPERALQRQELVEAKFISFREKKTLDPLVLQTLRNYENYDNARMAKQLVANEVKTLGTLFGNARIVAVATTLALGNIYVDSSGNLLPTSSGSSKTFSQQIASDHIGTILDTSSVGIFGATGGGSWANPSTNIPLQITRLKKLAAMTHGYKPKIALYGENVLGYMSTNDYLIDLLAREGYSRQQLMEDNTIPNGILGMEWIPAYEASYEKDDGTKTSLWDADGVTFLPGQDDAPNFWSMFEGSNFVPTTIDVQTDAMAALNSAQQVFGGYGYARMTDDPIAVHAIMGDCVLPAVRLPDTVYIANVVD